MECTVTSKGQITIPKKIRDAFELKVGDRVALTLIDDGQVIMTRRNRKIADLAGFLGDPPGGGPATLEEIDEAVRKAVGEHVAGKAGRHEDAA